LNAWSGTNNPSAARRVVAGNSQPPEDIEMTVGRISLGVLAGALVMVAIPSRLVSAQPVPAAALVRRALPSDTMIEGVPCARSGRAPAEFHLNERLAGCALSREHAVGAHRFGKGTWLDFNARGTLWGAWLENDTRLDGHLCRGEGYKKWSVSFHANGRLAGCYLTIDTVVEGVPCMAGSFLREIRGGGKTALRLDDTGGFARCQAARDTTLNGRVVRKWEVVTRAHE
jgi:hypothetical protein